MFLRNSFYRFDRRDGVLLADYGEWHLESVLRGLDHMHHLIGEILARRYAGPENYHLGHTFSGKNNGQCNMQMKGLI